MEKYSAQFSLSYSGYAEANNIDIPTDDIIDKWKSSIISYYSESTSNDTIMQMFDLPDNKRKNVEYHQYEISVKDYIINKKEQNILFDLTIKI